MEWAWLPYLSLTLTAANNWKWKRMDRERRALVPHSPYNIPVQVHLFRGQIKILEYEYSMVKRRIKYAGLYFIYTCYLLSACNVNGGSSQNSGLVKFERSVLPPGRVRDGLGRLSQHGHNDQGQQQKEVKGRNAEHVARRIAASTMTRGWKCEYFYLLTLKHSRVTYIRCACCFTLSLLYMQRNNFM